MLKCISWHQFCHLRCSRRAHRGWKCCTGATRPQHPLHQRHFTSALSLDNSKNLCHQIHVLCSRYVEPNNTTLLAHIQAVATHTFFADPSHDSNDMRPQRIKDDVLKQTETDAWINWATTDARRCKKVYNDVRTPTHCTADLPTNY